MKAAIVTRYGPPDVVMIRDVAKPEPGPNDVLIRVHATTVTRTDWGELRPGPMRIFYGLSRPRRSIFGIDVAGVVDSVGANVTAFRPGDRVFGLSPAARNGAQAEYVCVPDSAAIATLPDAVRFEDAVVCEGAYYADGGLKKFNIGPASNVLIYGASGAIGSAAVQLAKLRGARVTAVVPSHCVEMARSIGADRVVDYMTEDFTKLEDRFDYILDAVGKTSYFRCRRLLKPDGAYAATDAGPGGQNLPLVLWSALTGSRRVTVPLQPRGAGPAFVAQMQAYLAAGRYRAAIDRHYPLDAIADAYRYVGEKQKVGIVVVDVA